tara:strand:- start:197 stop:706 length:510 start_codon:yes stop_codon:yes gene_type:complete
MSQDSTTNALDQIDPQRRGFLSRLLAGGAVLTALPAMSTVALGDEDGQGKGGFGGKGKGKGGQGGQQGKGGFGGKGGGPGGQMDPKRLAAMFIQRYDKDGDKALNAQELEAALTGMMQRMRGGRGGQGGPGRGGFGQGKGGFGGKGKGGFGGGGSQQGGATPRRPPTEE